MEPQIDKTVHQVPIVLTIYGHVLVNARTNEEALKTVRGMPIGRIKQFFKEEYSFCSIGVKYDEVSEQSEFPAILETDDGEENHDDIQSDGQLQGAT